jgi:hypothetical protein
VAEFGAGPGSTPYLRQYCNDEGREFYSFDSDKEWAGQWGSEYIVDWNEDHIYRPYSVALVDQAPGECRKISLMALKDIAEIIVIHDLEPEVEHIYGISEFLPQFKSVLWHKEQRIWTVAVSNFMDLSGYSRIVSIANDEIIFDYKFEKE